MALKRILRALTLGVFLALLCPVPSYAIAPPASTDLQDFAYRNLLETGDQLHIIIYFARYTTYPTENASQALRFQLMQGATPLGSATPYAVTPYNGWMVGVASIYFSAATAPTWGEPYSVKMSGNTALTWSGTFTPVYASVNWSGATTQANSRIDLGNRIIACGLALDANWNVTTLKLVQPMGLNYYLTSDGQRYFALAVPNLTAYCPGLFPAQATQPQYKTDTPTLTYQPTLLPDRDVSDAAAIFGISGLTMTSLLSMAAIVICMLFLIGKRPDLSRFAFLFTGALAIFFASAGWMAMFWITLLVTVCLFIVGFVLFYERANG